MKYSDKFYSEVAREIAREDEALARIDRPHVQKVNRNGHQPHPTRSIHLTCASTIKPRPVRWLWEDRMALGTLTLVGGREGIGKSIFVYTLAADITRGLLRGVYHGTPKAVIVAATEDSWEHVIIPRLMAAGADLRLVYRVDVTTSDGVGSSLSLPRDLAELEQGTGRVDAALAILDPLLSRLDTALDSHKDAEVRLALEPLVALAERTSMTVVGLIHVNKSTSSDPLTTLMASRAFAAVARSVLFVMQDPHDETLRLLGTAKNNLGRTDLATMSFRIVGVKVTDTAEGEVWTGKLEWSGESERSIRDALQEAAEMGGDRTATSEAMDWLQDFLAAEDGSADSAMIKREAAKAGHSTDSLKRARRKLGITAISLGFPRRTIWKLLQSEQPVGATSGETSLTTPTALTGRQSMQSEQSVQSERSGGT